MFHSYLKNNVLITLTIIPTAKNAITHAKTLLSKISIFVLIFLPIDENIITTNECATNAPLKAPSKIDKIFAETLFIAENIDV